MSNQGRRFFNAIHFLNFVSEVPDLISLLQFDWESIIVIFAILVERILNVIDLQSDVFSAWNRHGYHHEWVKGDGDSLADRAIEG